MFAKAKSVPGSGWQFAILVRFNDGNTMVNQETIEFNTYTTEWQKTAGAAKAEGKYDSIQFWLLYYDNCNEVIFDSAQLIKDNFGHTYKYDGKRNLVSMTELNEKDYTFSCNENNKLISQTNLRGSKMCIICFKNYEY